MVVGAARRDVTIHGVLSGGAGGTYSGTLHAVPYGAPTGTCGPICAPVTGTIDFTTPAGSFSTSVTGDVGAESTASHESYSFRLTLDIVSGTRSFSHASGELALEYLSSRFQGAANGCFPVCEIRDSGTLTGTVVRGYGSRPTARSTASQASSEATTPRATLSRAGFSTSSVETA